MNAIDPGTLDWVRAEIDETLKQARIALESAAERPGDDAPLRHCQTWLHQVLGTLRMVELDGPALLATEIEALASALADGTQAVDRDKLTALTRGIITLGDYVGRLHAGQPDVPLRFLPVLNELRALRGEGVIAELDLFSPDLSVRAPSVGGHSASDETFAAEAARVRPLFQKALADWLRAPDDAKPLARVCEYLDDLRARANQPFYAQLFWVGAAFAEALAMGALMPTLERRRVIGRIEQRLRSVTDGSGRARAQSESESLTRSILFELAQTPRAGSRVDEVKYAFGLDQLLTGSAAEEAVALPSPEALGAVSSALRTEVSEVQEALDGWVEGGAKEAPAPALIERLGRMASTVAMLGVEPLRRLIEQLAATLVAIGQQRVSPGDASSMAIAKGVLLIETTVRDFQTLGPEWLAQVESAINALRRLETPGAPASTGMEVTDTSLSDNEFRQLLGNVAKEIRVNLARAEEYVESAATTRAASALGDAAPFLAQVQGALQILGEQDAAQLAQTIRDRAVEAAGGPAPGALTLDAFAFAIGTLGSYVDGLEAGRTNLDGLLDAAWRDLDAAHTGHRVSDADATALAAAVGEATRAWFENAGSRGLLGVLRQTLRDLSNLAIRRGNDRLRRITHEMSALADMVANDPAKLSDEVRATVIASTESLRAIAAEMAVAPSPVAGVPAMGQAPGAPAAASAPAPTSTSAPAVAPTPAPASVPVPVDPEIVEIFIEDAREILGTIARALPTWESQPANNEALLELRRAFHTLKGSGRMVGARDISEFAWTLENMLNRVRDGKISAVPGMFALLHATAGMLPGMVDALAAGAPADVARAERLSAIADSFSRGEPVEAAAIAAVEAAPAAPPAAAPEIEVHETIAAVPVTADPAPEELPGAPPAEQAVEAADAESFAFARDPILLEIFSNEARGHVATLERLVSDSHAAAGKLPIEEAFTRAAHTLAGSARALEIAPMADVCAELEKILLHHDEANAPLTDAVIADVERAARAVSSLIDALQTGAGTLNDAERLFAGLRASLAAHPVPESARVARIAPGAPAPAAPAVEMESLPPGVDPELVEIFIEEAADILGSIDASLARLRSDDGDRAALGELKRSLHTLKGGARMAGLTGMGDLGHALESALLGVEDGRVTATGAIYELVTEAHDTLGAAIDRLRAHEPYPSLRGLQARVEELLSGRAASAGAATVIEEINVSPDAGGLFAPPEEAETIEIGSTVADEPRPLAAAGEPSRSVDDVVVPFAARRPPAAEEEGDLGRRAEVPGLEIGEAVDRRGHVRVRAALLNNLVNYAGEVAIARSRMQQQINGFRDSLAELSRNIARFRDQIRELEIHSETQIRARDEETVSRTGQDFDPLEFDRYSRLQQLSRGLSESLHDLYTIESSLDSFAGEAETVLAQQARVNTELQEGLMRTRMIAIATQGPRLRHIVRQTARELDKNVEFRLVGGDVELDRSVLERMIGPFEHMIRNSVDHGIENRAERARAGKPAGGQITLDGHLEGTEIVLRFSDDGRGLDLDAIQQRARERGLIAPGAQPSDRDLMQLILLPGFSTARSVTQLSGRGVGMDVVDTEVKNLGGRLLVESEAGRGTTFMIRLPVTLSIMQALMAHAGDETYCIPLVAVTNIVDAPMEQLAATGTDGLPAFAHGGRDLPLLNLATRLGTRPEPRNPRKAQVLIMKGAAQEFAVQVDGLGSAREIVVKPLSPWMNRVSGVSAGTILGDGRVALILDAAGLWLGADRVTHEPVEQVESTKAPARPRIMVVDDSITVRKVTARFLEKNDMEAIAAKDGVEALELLREELPDVMLVDIEMPRMDGYELTASVRADARTRHIPIVMITSRAGGKHRDRAFELGVNAFLSKPYQEDELLRNINAMLRGERLH